jgi:ribonuclease P/MRP protein subunit POP5
LLKKTKRRYLALEIDSTETIEAKEFMDAVWSVIIRLYGEHGASKTGLTMIDYNTESKLALIRVTNAASDIVRAAVATMTKMGGKPVGVHVVAVSGTIRALCKRVRQRQ